MGGIGKAIAKRAHFGFDMQILYHNRSRNEYAEENFEATYCSLEELLLQSHYVCLMAPLTAETENLMGKREFELMKKLRSSSMAQEEKRWMKKSSCTCTKNG